FLSRAEPTETRIDEEVALRSGVAAYSYRLKELGIRFTGNEAEDNRNREVLLDLYERLSQGGDFEAAVAEFSESPSRDNGGDIGWVPAAGLPPDLVRDLNLLNAGEVTRPVSVQGGASILQLIERRLGGANPNVSQEDREQVRQQLLAEEINRLADGYLQELRRDALIELR
ncbi:MAG: peptidylprolyl isomerase, partial [Pseudomonadota bacterium]